MKQTIKQAILASLALPFLPIGFLAFMIYLGIMGGWEAGKQFAEKRFEEQGV